MAQYSYKYSGVQAAFILAGFCTLPAGVAVTVDDKAHKALAKNKFVKHLVDSGELVIEEAQEAKPTGRGVKGSQGSKADKTDAGKEGGNELDDVRTALTDLEITFTDEETIDELKTKLAQVTE